MEQDEFEKYLLNRIDYFESTIAPKELVHHAEGLEVRNHLLGLVQGFRLAHEGYKKIKAEHICANCLHKAEFRQCNALGIGIQTHFSCNHFKRRE